MMQKMVILLLLCYAHLQAYDIKNDVDYKNSVALHFAPTQKDNVAINKQVESDKEIYERSKDAWWQRVLKRIKKFFAEMVQMLGFDDTVNVVPHKKDNS